MTEPTPEQTIETLKERIDDLEQEMTDMREAHQTEVEGLNEQLNEAHAILKEINNLSQ